MKPRLVSLTLSVILLVYAFSVGGLAWVLAWPALSLGFVAVAYLGCGPGVFGKRPSGEIPLRIEVRCAKHLTRGCRPP